MTNADTCGAACQALKYFLSKNATLKATVQLGAPLALRALLVQKYKY
jgi:hypothetical protein